MTSCARFGFYFCWISPGAKQNTTSSVNGNTQSKSTWDLIHAFDPYRYRYTHSSLASVKFISNWHSSLSHCCGESVRTCHKLALSQIDTPNNTSSAKLVQLHLVWLNCLFARCGSFLSYSIVKTCRQNCVHIMTGPCVGHIYLQLRTGMTRFMPSSRTLTYRSL